jgi:hypothetical protein
MEVADGNGGKAQTQFEVTVHQLTGPPVIALDPQPQTVLSGSTVTLRVVATGPSPLSYRWQRNGGDILGANASTLVFPSIQRGNTGDYRVIVSNSGGSATSASAHVQVYDAARIISLSRSGNVVQLSFNTTLGQRYTIEYRDSLNSGAWTTLEAVDGTGSALTRSDSTASGATRFYRLRVD